MRKFFEELSWRGLIHDYTPAIKELSEDKIIKAYIGFDPTADSLHVGSLVQIMLLVHLQRAGHSPVALVGGATGMVGDPSGKSKERNLLGEEEISHNLQCIEKQLRKFLRFEGVENKAEVVNNFDWFGGMSFLNFIRDVGKHMTISYMIAKDSVQKRLETGMSFTEFSYQLVQGYDFLRLYEDKGCILQLGGSDQWGNMLTGTELIRRMLGKEAYAITSPLITKADGGKFGKTEEGNIWLDPEKTSPYHFYQFWINASDEDAPKYIRIFTILEKEEIEALEKEHNEAPHLRILQKQLAKEITSLVHGESEYENAVKASNLLFGKSTLNDLKSINEQTLLQVFEGVPKITLSKSELSEAKDICEFLSTTTQNIIFQSKGEARRMIQGGGVSINKEKISGIEDPINKELLQGKYQLIQKGKKNYYLVEYA